MMPFARDRLAEQLRRLAVRGVYAGTSSWKYQGWLNQVYSAERYTRKGAFSTSDFERTCLEEYAQVFKTVCIDAAYYRFPEPRYLTFLASQVPDDFLFALKVTDQITIRRFPNLVRFGPRTGSMNPDFLNVDLFASRFLSACEPVRRHIGLLIFEFSTIHRDEFARGRDFVQALDSFLGRLPGGWPYAVEIRNATFLEPPYFATLKHHSVTHVLNSWERMPPLPEQLSLADVQTTPERSAARLLLQPGRRYAEAVRAFTPYDKIVEPCASARAGAVTLIRNAIAQDGRSKTMIYVNNRLEGNAPQTIWAILDQAGLLT